MTSGQSSDESNDKNTFDIALTTLLQAADNGVDLTEHPQIVTLLDGTTRELVIEERHHATDDHDDG